MTEEEKKLKSFTRRNLKTLPEHLWLKWKESYFKQLDTFASDEVFGKPVRPPPDAIVMLPQWANIMKADGTRKTRLCCNGSPKMALKLHAMANTYSSCIEQPCMRLFFAITSALGFYLRSSDCTNAFQMCHGSPVSRLN